MLELSLRAKAKAIKFNKRPHTSDLYTLQLFNLKLPRLEYVMTQQGSMMNSMLPRGPATHCMPPFSSTKTQSNVSLACIIGNVKYTLGNYRKSRNANAADLELG